MRKQHLLLTLLSAYSIILFSCQNLPKESTATYDIDLVETKKITLPVDENTYYMSRSIFQFEEDGREFLHFQNTEKRQYEIVIYDIDSSKIEKRIPMHKEGPNGVPVVMASKPIAGSNHTLLFQSNAGRITSFDQAGKVVRNYSIKSPEGRFMAFLPCSYFFTSPYIKDSVLFVAPKIGKPNMKKEDWPQTPMFFMLDLKTGDIDFAPINYPSIFKKDVKRLADGGSFSYDFNSEESRLVCSFVDYDSLMVVDSDYVVKWFNGKSRYIEIKEPRLIEVGEGLDGIIKMSEQGHYFHVMYDKYRDVYYRFAEMPYELKSNESPLDDPQRREFSVIIFDKDFRIIGETKFPGNKYYIRMSFVGRDGLYISENNLANPEFDEDKLVFACFKLEKLNKKEQ